MGQLLAAAAMRQHLSLPGVGGVQHQRLDLLSISWCTPVVGNSNVDGRSGAVLFPHNGTTAG